MRMPSRVVAAVPERRRAARADPLAAAFVALLLFFEEFLQALHQLVEASPALRSCAFSSGGEVAFQPLFLSQSSGTSNAGFVELLHAVEIRARTPRSNLSKYFSSFDERQCARESRTRRAVGRDHLAPSSASMQRQVFLDGHRQLRAAQRCRRSRSAWGRTPESGWLAGQRRPPAFGAGSLGRCFADIHAHTRPAASRERSAVVAVHEEQPLEPAVVAVQRE